MWRVHVAKQFPAIQYDLTKENSKYQCPLWRGHQSKSTKHNRKKKQTKNQLKSTKRGCAFAYLVSIWFVFTLGVDAKLKFCLYKRRPLVLIYFHGAFVNGQGPGRGNPIYTVRMHDHQWQSSTHESTLPFQINWTAYTVAGLTRQLIKKYKSINQSINQSIQISRNQNPTPPLPQILVSSVKK